MRKIGALVVLFMGLHSRASAQDLKLVRSLSGASGKIAGNTFVFDETRNRFVYPQDQSLTVLFEWEATPGLHVLSGVWKLPDGRVASISPDVKIEAPGKGLSCYWIFHLTPGMTNGVWTLDVRIDGQPAGSHPFEIAGMMEPRLETAVQQAPAPKTLTTDDVYKAASPSMVWIHKLDSTGRRFDVSSGFVFRKGLILTAFQSIDSADKIEVEFADGRRVVQDELVAWSRTGDWAIVAADTGSLLPIPAGAAGAIAVGERLLVFNFENGARVIGGVDIGGRQTFAGFGERIQLSPSLAPQSAGGPLLNLNGEVVGILGGAMNQGGHFADRALSISPGLWNGIQPENAAVPISSVPNNQPANGENLRTLASNGTLTAPLIPTAEFLYGGTSTSLSRNANDPKSPDIRDFSVRDSVWVYSFWERRGKATKGEVGAKVYDPLNRVRVSVRPKKIYLGSEPDRVAFSFAASDLMPGLYRVDVTWNGDAAWRTFIRVTP